MNFETLVALADDRNFKKHLLELQLFSQPDDKDLRKVARILVKNIYALGECRIPLVEDTHIDRILALIKPVKQCPFDEGGVCHVFDNDKEE